MPYGFDDDEWRVAKDEAVGILSERAAQPVNFIIFYSHLCNLIQTIEFAYDSKVFWEFLGEISTEEYLAGRGMLTAIVVLKDAEHKPGTGFLACAAELGLDVSNPDRVWNDQLNFVHDYWTRAARENG
jgi:hypothetical protein